jgi:ribosomal protein S18 acetylase RimI-like enzyme
MIREAAPADIYPIQRIAEAAFAPFVESIGAKPEPMQANFGRQIEKGQIEVLVKSTGIRGYCVSYPKGLRWHIENIAVAPDSQGEGVGTALIADAEKRAALMGFDTIDLYTNVHMTKAILWYEFLGYVETERSEQNGFQRVFFAKELSP